MIDEYLDVFGSTVSLGQAQRLQEFLRSDRTLSEADLQETLERLGEKSFTPPEDPTRAEEFNRGVRQALADLSGLYHDATALDLLVERLRALNEAELDNAEARVEELESYLDQVSEMIHQGVAYTQPLIHENFAPTTLRDPDPALYRDATPLWINPEDRTLRFPAGGDFSRTLSRSGRPLCTATLEQQIGLSEETDHPLEEALDGSLGTFWRETFLADAPIWVDREQVPWLKTHDPGGYYDGGPVVQVRLDFPYVTPVSEILVRPFSKFPMKLLSVAYDLSEHQSDATNLVQEATFETSGSLASGSPWTTLFVEWVSGGLEGGCAKLGTVGGHDLGVLSQDVELPVPGSGQSAVDQQYTLRITLRREGDPWYTCQVQTASGSGFVGDELLSTQEIEIASRTGRWWSDLEEVVTVPAGARYARITLAHFDMDGSAPVTYVDALRFTRNVEVIAVGKESSELLSHKLPRAYCRRLWLTFSQPHYQFRQYQGSRGLAAVPEPGAEETAFLSEPTSGGWPLEPSERLPLPGDSLLRREVRRLGGYVRNLAARLVALAEPPQDPVTRSCYEYVLGAWEIDVRHRGYVSYGRYVSRPLPVQGEPRYLQILWDRDPDVNYPISVYLVPRADQPVDGEALAAGVDEGTVARIYHEGSGPRRCAFSPTPEPLGFAAEEYEDGVPHLRLDPRRHQDVFDSTDRYKRVRLTNFPYVNLGRVRSLRDALSSGLTVADARVPVYDPNTDRYEVPDGSGGTLEYEGYRPLSVWIDFGGNDVAVPDTQGPPQPGLILRAEQETLQRATRQVTLEQQLRSELLQSTDTTTTQAEAYTTRYPIFLFRPQGAAGGAPATSQVLQLWWRSQYQYATKPDVAIPASGYTLNPETGVITVTQPRPSTSGDYNPALPPDVDYDTVVATYTYLAPESVAETAAARYSSGRRYPVTRNRTDYLTGQVPTLRPYREGVYEVYEYYVDALGRLCFHEETELFREQRVRIVAEYESLDLKPRVVIEYGHPGSLDTFTETPVLHNYSVVVSARR